MIDGWRGLHHALKDFVDVGLMLMMMKWVQEMTTNEFRLKIY